MRNYVLGFRFDDELEKVVLIRKNRPDWQRGKLNGVGGKVEAGEDNESAMAREFLEETGASTSRFDWERFAFLGGTDFDVVCLISIGDIEGCGKVEEEPVEIFNIAQLYERREELLGSVRWLIPLALEFLSDRPCVVNAVYFEDQEQLDAILRTREN